MSAESAADPGGVIGTWELVGVGDLHGYVTTPERLVISFLASGKCELRTWEHGDLQPFETDCDFALPNGILEITHRAFGGTESFRIGWDLRMLILHPLDDTPGRPLPLRFERRAWVTF